MSGRVQRDVALGLVRARLLSVAAVTALVSNRISGGWPESADQGTIPRPSVALQIGAGSGTYAGAIADLQVEIVALSAISASEARTVYDAVYDALQAEGLSTDNVDHRGLIREMDGGGPVDSWWEAGRCWTTMGRWRLTVVRDNP